MDAKRTIGMMTAAACGLLLGASAAQAANGTWNGTALNPAGPTSAGQLWSDPLKWVGSTVAGTTGTTDSPDTLFMNTDNHYTLTLDANYNISNAYHNVATHRHAIVRALGDSTSILSLSGGGSIYGNSGNLHYYIPVRLEGGSGGSYTFNKAQFTVYAPVTGTAATGGNYDLILNGSGTVDSTTVSGYGTYTGTLGDGTGGGTLSLIKTGTGAWYLKTANPYTGTTTIREGSVRLGNTGAMGAATSTVALGDALTPSAAYVELEIEANGTYTRNIGVNNVNPSGTSAIVVRQNRGPVWGGTVTLNRDTTFHNENSGNLTVSGQITGTGGIVKTGPNNLTLSNAGNNYQGGTTVNAGLLIVGVAGPLASSPVTVNGGVLRANQGVGLGAANSLALNGGVWEPSAAITRTTGSGAGEVQLAGTSGFSAFGAAVNVNLNSGAGLVWGSTAGFNPTTLVLNQTTANNALTLQNALDLNGTDRTIAVNANAANTATISGAIGNGSGTAGLTKSGAGTLNLTGLNTFNGGLTLNGGALNVRNTNTLVSAVTANSGSLTVDYTGQNTGAALIPATASLTLGGGTFSVTGSGVAGQATAQTVNGLTLANSASTVAATANGGRPVVLDLGAITRASATATANFALPAGTQDTANGILTSSGSANTRLGMWATVNGSEWAAKDAENDNIVPWSSVGGTYTDVTRLSSGSKTIASNPASDVRIIDGTGTAASITPAAAGTTDIATLFAGVTGGTATYDPGASDVLRLSATGTVALTGATGSGALTIGTAANDGILTAGGAVNADGTLSFVNNHPSNLILVNSSIANNGAGVVGVESAGLGAVALNGSSIFSYTGNTVAHSGGTVRYDYGTTVTLLAAGAGTMRLDGGTLHLNFLGNSWGHNLTFSSPIQIDANGGTINLAPDASGQRRAAVSFTGGISLNGKLTVTGNSWANTLVNPPSLGTVTLNTNAAISNTTFNTPATVNLGPSLIGSTRSLTLGGGAFAISGATAASVNLSGLTVGDGASLSLSAGNGINPLNQIKNVNGGLLTIGNRSTLTFLGTGTGTGPILDPTAISWQGDGTLNLPVVTGGNGDSYWRIIADLIVSSASGLTRVNYTRWRQTLTIDSPYALTVGSGGTLNVSVGDQTVPGSMNGNLALLNGATVLGANVTAARGGLLRSGGTLTLGDGSGTPGSPSVVTLAGNHDTRTPTFVLGYVGNTTESGTVRMKYASTGATIGHIFNIGWGGTGTSPTMQALQETSGGTEFAPLPSGGGVAIVGATSGTVAAFAKPATLTTTGTVGFYNAGANNTRGNLGPLEIASTGSLVFEDAGKVLASDVTFKTGAALNVRLTGASPTACSLVDASGTLTFESGTAITITEEPGLPTAYKGPWYVAKGATLSGLPKKSAGLYTVTAEAGYVRIDRLASGTVLLLR